MIIDPWGLDVCGGGVSVLAYLLQSAPLGVFAPILWMGKQRLTEAVTCQRCPGLSAV